MDGINRVKTGREMIPLNKSPLWAPMVKNLSHLSGRAPPPNPSSPACRKSHSQFCVVFLSATLDALSSLGCSTFPFIASSSTLGRTCSFCSIVPFFVLHSYPIALQNQTHTVAVTRPWRHQQLEKPWRCHHPSRKRTDRGHQPASSTVPSNSHRSIRDT